jgi:hypothetical protein
VVDDPELGELIRIALANLPESKKVTRFYHNRDREREKYDQLLDQERVAKLSTVRSITEAYSQIKLLDFQIEQLERKVSSASRTRAVQAELILAKAELEAKRSTILAELREVMNIVPKHAFGRQSEADLKNWLALDVIDDSVYVLKYDRPFRGRGKYPIFAQAVGVMSKETALTYIKDLVKTKNELPLRVTIFRTESGARPSERLYQQVVETIEHAKVEMETDVYLAEVRQDLAIYERLISLGKIYTSMHDLRRGQAFDEQDFFTRLDQRYLTTPGRFLPCRYVIKVDADADSKDLANRMIDAIKAKAKDLGVEQFVEIKQEEAEFDIPDPEEEAKPRRTPARSRR